MDDMHKTRVLILLPGMQMFGQETALLGLAKLLRPLGCECSFLLHSSWGQVIASRLEKEGFGYFLLPMGTLWSSRMSLRDPLSPVRNILGTISSSLALKNILTKETYSQLIIGNSTFGLYLLPALYFSNIPLIWRHGDEPTTHSWFHRLASRLLFSRANLHVANCAFIARRLAKLIPNRLVKIIYNTPVNRLVEDGEANHVDHMVNQIQRSNDEVRLLFIGQLGEHKGIMLLIDAFEMLIDEFPAMTLDIVGDIPGVGEYRPRNIAGAVAGLLGRHPSKVFHYGYQSNIDPYCKRAHVHIFPSIWPEPSPNVVMEAKQYGLPSVAFDVGGVSELISHGEDGYICQEISAAAFAEGIRYFLIDNERRLRSGRLAKQSIETRFGNLRFVEEWSEVLGLEVREDGHD